MEIHLSKGLTRGKSDKKDALMIAHYALSNKYKLKLSKLNNFDIEKLKVLNNQRNRISKAIVSFKLAYENKDFLPIEFTKVSNKINDSIISKLNKSLKAVEKEIDKIINANTKLKLTFN